MKVKIYCIEDHYGLKYVGSTTQPLIKRLCQHKSHDSCSSSKLDLYSSFIYLIEECDECDRKEREQYWINNTDCVNIKKLNFDKTEYIKEYREKNKDKLNSYHKEYNKQYNKQYYIDNKEKRLEINREWKLFNSKKVCNGCYDFIMMLNQY